MTPRWAYEDCLAWRLPLTPLEQGRARGSARDGKHMQRGFRRATAKPQVLRWPEL